MKEKDNIEKLFSEKLRNAEASVNAELWTSISSGLASNASISSTLSSTTKIFIWVGAISSMTIGSIFLFKTVKEDKVKTFQTKEIKAESKKQLDKKDSVIFIKQSLQEIVKNRNQRKSEPAKIIASDQLIIDIKGLTQEIIRKENQYKSETIEDDPRLVDDKDLKLNNIKSEDPPIIPKEEKTNDKTKNQSILTEEILAYEESSSKVEEKSNDLFIGKLPNVFNPNNDLKNDYFFIEIRGILDFSIIVLNKENKCVYSSKDPNFKWDGKDLQNNLVPEDTYIYFFTGKDSLGKYISKSSTLRVQHQH